MLYDNTTRTLTLDKRDCYCGDGTQNWVGPCPVCDGTGRGPRGGARGCKTCWGGGRKVDQSRTMTCTRCNGDWQRMEDENWTHDAPDEAVLSLPIRVVRSERRMSWVESYIGLGLWSCTDYGRAWEGTDADVIEKVTADLRHVQACKITRKTDDEKVLVLCDELVIALSPQGYSVIGSFHNEMGA